MAAKDNKTFSKRSSIPKNRNSNCYSNAAQQFIKSEITSSPVPKYVPWIPILACNFPSTKNTSLIAYNFHGSKPTCRDLKFGRKLGKGGFGETYECQFRTTIQIDGKNQNTNEIFAVKKIQKRGRKKSDKKTAKMEHFCLHKLNHDNLVSGLFTTEDLYYVYFAMPKYSYNFLELILELENHSGDTLIPELHIVVIDSLRQVLLGINDLHKNNILHRDIKPENILVDAKTGLVKLGDFGLAVNLQKDNPVTGKAGTNSYMAPEVKANQPYSTPADIFSFVTMVGKIYLQLFVKKYQVIEPIEYHLDYFCGHEHWYPALKNVFDNGLVLNPEHRMTAAELLELPYFTQNLEQSFNVTL